MKELLQTTIEQLRFHVMKNLELVRENEEKIKEIMKEPITTVNARALSEKYDYSKKILAENNDFINMQLNIINFIYKYKRFWEQEEEFAVVQDIKSNAFTKDECFQLTIESKMEFGPTHPYYSDDTFFTNLLDYFQTQEDYEKCDELVKKKRDLL